MSLERLLDRDAINTVLNRYATALDERDWDALDAVFAADATAHFQGIGTFDCRAAIKELVRSVLAKCGPTQHLLGNVEIEVDGDDARSRCYLQAMHAGVGDYAGERMTVWGEYRDRLRRLPEGWRIVHRDLLGIHAEGDVGMEIVSPD